MDDWPTAIDAGLAVVGPHLWWLIPVVLLIAVLRFPMLGRGPVASDG